MQHVLSIQSFVASGRVGNRAATFALERLGFEVAVVPTVLLAHHPGLGPAAGFTLTPAALSDLLAGLERSGRLAGCSGVLCGYLGRADNGPVVLEAVSRLRRADRAPTFLCDPVIGEDGKGIFVRPGLPEFFRDRAIGTADIVTPNRFELEWLSGVAVVDLDTARRAAAALRTRGARIVVGTGLPGTSPATIGVLLESTDLALWAETPRLDRPTAGAGDLFAACLLGALLSGNEPKAALEQAVSATFAVLNASAGGPSDELALVAAQHALVAPPHRFEATLLPAAPARRASHPRKQRSRRLD